MIGARIRCREDRIIVYVRLESIGCTSGEKMEGENVDEDETRDGRNCLNI